MIAPESPPVQIELCEMCGTPIAAGHSHVVDTVRRALMCACRACFLVFTAGTRYRAVPERYLWDPSQPVTTQEWAALHLPVDLAFILRCDNGVAAFYPSPAGAAECPLNQETWTELAMRHPLLATAEPHVEAILVHGSECFLVPVDVCYRLVGTVRRYWTCAVGTHIDELFAEIRERAQPLAPKPG